MSEQKDYRELFSDTVGSLLSKAREFAESDAVADAVGKVKNAAAATGVLDVYQKGAQRAKSFGNATKTTLDLNRDHKELERVFCEIGKLCYEQSKESPEGFFVPLFQQVEALRASIAAKEAEVEAYKASFDSAPQAQAKADASLRSDISDFEAVVNRTETDGTSV